MSYLADELADIVRADSRGDLAHGHDQERADRHAENADRPCWSCGGSGVRCCEFGADR